MLVMVHRIGLGEVDCIGPEEVDRIVDSALGEDTAVAVDILHTVVVVGAGIVAAVVDNHHRILWHKSSQL